MCSFALYVLGEAGGDSEDGCPHVPGAAIELLELLELLNQTLWAAEAVPGMLHHL